MCVCEFVYSFCTETNNRLYSEHTLTLWGVLYIAQNYFHIHHLLIFSYLCHTHIFCIQCTVASYMRVYVCLSVCVCVCMRSSRGSMCS